MFRRHCLAGLAVLLLISPVVRASDFSFTGTFTNDTDLQFFTFTLINPTPAVTFRTWSYAGGTNAAGQVISSGGFEPFLNFYGPGGTQMNPGFSGPCTAVPSGNPLADLLPDPITSTCSDVYYPTTISFPAGVWDAGTYTVVLSLFANQGIGDLSAGFFAPDVLGLPVPSNFTCQVGAPGYQGNPPTVPVDQPFCDGFAAGVQRSGNWALDILNVDSAEGPSTAPEPGTFLLGALGGLAFVAKRFRSR